MFSKVVRRTHMYLALFLTPWVLMYALSTMAMNHRELLRKRYAGPVVAFEKERDIPYPTSFAPDVKPSDVGQRVLRDLKLEGAFNARREGNGDVVITRQAPLTLKRVTYKPAESKLVLEREVFRSLPFLERMHRRRGYQHPFVLEDAWASSVDLTIIALVFWVLSGVWMWWELRATRLLGALFLAVGIALFGLFVYTI
jgi:hypothetical protein